MAVLMLVVAVSCVLRAAAFPPHLMPATRPLVPDFENIRKLAEKGSSIEDMLPMLMDEWSFRWPKTQFPIKEDKTPDSVNMIVQTAPGARQESVEQPSSNSRLLAPANQVSSPASAAIVAATQMAQQARTAPAEVVPAQQLVAAQANTTADPTPAATPSKPAQIEGGGLSKVPYCQPASKLSYCTGVNYAVPYQGWAEWEKYVEDTLKYYMENLYQDGGSSDDGDNAPAGGNSTSVTVVKSFTSPQCAAAMKAIGCAFYFPRCDENMVPLPPCKSLCKRWKKELKCPGSPIYNCEGANGGSFAFTSSGDEKCTGYSGAMAASSATATATQQLQAGTD